MKKKKQKQKRAMTTIPSSSLRLSASLQSQPEDIRQTQHSDLAADAQSDLASPLQQTLPSSPPPYSSPTVQADAEDRSSWRCPKCPPLRSSFTPGQRQGHITRQHRDDSWTEGEANAFGYFWCPCGRPIPTEKGIMLHRSKTRCSEFIDKGGATKEKAGPPGIVKQEASTQDIATDVDYAIPPSTSQSDPDATLVLAASLPSTSPSLAQPVPSSSHFPIAAALPSTSASSASSATQPEPNTPASTDASVASPSHFDCFAQQPLRPRLSRPRLPGPISDLQGLVFAPSSPDLSLRQQPQPDIQQTESGPSSAPCSASASAPAVPASLTSIDLIDFLSSSPPPLSTAPPLLPVQLRPSPTLPRLVPTSPLPLPNAKRGKGREVLSDLDSAGLLELEDDSFRRLVRAILEEESFPELVGKLEAMLGRAGLAGGVSETGEKVF
jgi:hypothetical protein